MLLAAFESDRSHVQKLVTNDLATTNVTSANSALKMYLYACKLLDVLLAMPYSELHHFQLYVPPAVCFACQRPCVSSSFSFRSAFVTDEDSNERKPPLDTFIAFSLRLNRLLERKLQSMSASIRERLPVIKSSSRPLLRLRTITHIVELYPFFNCLTRMHTYDHHHYQHPLPTHGNTLSKQASLSKSKDSSKKKSKSLNSTSASRKAESASATSVQEETMSEIETSVLEDFVESWI